MTTWLTPCAAIPPSITCINAKAVGLTTSDDHQQVSLLNGSSISARLAVLAHGLIFALKDQVGIKRTVTHSCHSIRVAFDLKPRHARAFDFAALTYYSECAARRRSNGISHAVSHRSLDAREPVGLSDHGRSMAAGHAAAIQSTPCSH